MATAATNTKIRKARKGPRPLTQRERAPRRKGKEPWHGTLNGYSNRKCRCNDCKAAWAAYVAVYRASRFTGTVCSHRGCRRPPSVGAGNGLCYHHNLEETNA